jgi:acyl carrier protein
MGLDSVELVMEVEKTFNIRIPDAEAEKIYTVGDFYEVVWRHLKGRHSNKCNSQILFYNLRSKLAKRAGVPLKNVTPDSSPGSFFSGATARYAYKQLEQEMQLTFPDLKLQRPWSELWSWSATLLILGSLIIELVLINIWDYNSWILLWSIAAGLVVAGISKLIEPLRTEVPSETLRGFTMKVLTLNYKELTKSTGISRKEMEAVMNQIIVDKIGVDREEIESHKSLTDDLGVN